LHSTPSGDSPSRGSRFQRGQISFLSVPEVEIPRLLSRCDRVEVGLMRRDDGVEDDSVELVFGDVQIIEEKVERRWTLVLVLANQALRFGLFNAAVTKVQRRHLCDPVIAALQKLDVITNSLDVTFDLLVTV